MLALEPPKSVVKLKVDYRSLYNPSNLGFGGLIRNYNGEWL